MVNNVSKLLIDEIVDLDINYTLSEQEIKHLIPFFEHLERSRSKKVVSIVGESTISRSESAIHLEKSKFTGNKVQESLNKDIQEYGVCVELQTPSGNIKICIFGENQQEIDTYKKVIIDTIIFVFHLNLGQYKLNSINIFLTDLKKQVDLEDIFDHTKSISLSGEQVNTGVTYHYSHKSDIYLWRKEEIVKVCIHELIHSLDWDIRKSEDNIQSIFNKKLKINKEILLSEAYTEAWAEILNCYICSFMIETKPEEIFCRFIHYLEIETVFSIWQVIKIIHLTNTEQQCSLNDFLKITDKDTNVFPYYFLTASILFNVADWICLCDNVCDEYVNYTASNEHDKDIANWFSDNITSHDFYNLCKKIKNKFKENESKKIYNSMRMTVIECL
jgi:hypothetical protein